MAINLKIPIQAQPIITGNIFTAAFNVPTVNRYDFTNIAANQNVNVLELDRWSVYIIERYNFSTNASQPDYLEAIDTTQGLPNFQLTTTASDQQIFPQQQPLINYVDNLEVIQAFSTQQDNDFLRVSFRGAFSQVVGMITIPTMFAFLQMNIYKINEVDWIKKYYDMKEGQVDNVYLKGCN